MPTALRVVHKTDPKKVIYDDVGHLLKGFEPLADRILVVVYERGNQGKDVETVTPGGIIVVETSNGVLREDKWQGRVGLVVAVGPIAFKSDASHQWGDRTPKIGDWVMFDTTNTSPFDLPLKDGRHRRARFVQDVYVEAIVPEATFDAIW